MSEALSPPTTTSDRGPDSWAAIKGAARKAGLLAVVAASVLLAAVGAWVLTALLPFFFKSEWVKDGVTWLAEHYDWLVPPSLRSPESLATGIYLGVAAFGGVVLVGTLKEITGALPSLTEFVRQPSSDKLLKPVAVVFAACVGLTISLFALGRVSDPKPTLRLTFRSPALTTLQDPGDGLPVFYVVFAEEAGHEALVDASDPAVRVDPLFRPALQNLVSDLSACIESDTDEVELRVRGFASSSQWEEIEKTADRELISAKLQPLIDERRAGNLAEALNLWVAEQRANNVISLLNEARDGLPERARRQVTVSFEPQTLEAMRSRLVFKDVSDLKGYSSERALLTRRVEIRLTSVGDCLRNER